MEIVCLNASFYLLLLFFYWRKIKKIDNGFILLIIYSIIAIMGIFLYRTDPIAWKLQMWPFVYLFFIFLLFFRPFFFDNSLLVSRLHVKNLKTIKIFVYIYIFMSVITIYNQISTASENINSGDWLLIRSNFYQEESIIYGSIIEKIALRFTQFCQTAAVVIMFYFYTIGKSVKKINFFLFLSIILTSLLWAITTASRGSLFNLFLLLITSFMVFKNYISPNKRKIIYSLLITLFSIVILFSIAVTVSRFSTDEKTSLLFYFGHSMLTFNYGIADSIDSYLNGKYIFNWVYEIVGANSQINYDELGTHFGTAFFTFIGSLYLDFGPIGTLCIAILLPLFIYKVFRKKRYLDIAEIFIYIFYINYLISGVFVIGKNNSLSWIITIVLYFSLKIKSVNIVEPVIYPHEKSFKTD